MTMTYLRIDPFDYARVTGAGGDVSVKLAQEVMWKAIKKDLAGVVVIGRPYKTLREQDSYRLIVKPFLESVGIDTTNGIKTHDLNNNYYAGSAHMDYFELSQTVFSMMSLLGTEELGKNYNAFDYTVPEVLLVSDYLTATA